MFNQGHSLQQALCSLLRGQDAHALQGVPAPCLRFLQAFTAHVFSEIPVVLRQAVDMIMASVQSAFQHA